jgi:hypothetical protein
VDGMQMVPLATTRSAFEAQVLAARLGAEGIVWQLRGGSADSMYPLGEVDVLVAADDLEKASEMLETGAEPGWADDDPDEDWVPRRQRWRTATVVGACVIVFIVLRVFSLLRAW